MRANITLFTQISNNSLTWTAWTPYEDNNGGIGGTISTAVNTSQNVGRYIRYKAVFATPNPWITPSLENISISYSIPDITPPSFTTNPYNQTTTNHSVNVNWVTDESANYTLTIGLCPSFTGTNPFSNSTFATTHTQSIASLSNSTNYCVNVTASDSSFNRASANFSFRTAANPPQGAGGGGQPATSSSNEQNLVYDANGNMVSGDGFYREYNELNQLIRIRNSSSSGVILEEFVWHPVQEKILIKDVFKNGIKDTSIFYVSDEFIRIENSSGNYTEKYVYQDNVLVAQVNTNGNKEFVHNDHLGSVSLITDGSGNVLENTFFSPHGEILSGGKASRFDSEAKEYDELVKDYDFHFRKYKPQWGKFTQPDTLIQNVYDPQSLNRYSFERNNPYKYTDETGHLALETWLTIVIVANALSLLIGVYYSGKSKAAAYERLYATFEESREQKELNRQLISAGIPTNTKAEDVLAVSDEINLASIERTGEPPKIGEFKSAFIDEEEKDEEDDELLHGLKIKKDEDDTLPNPNDLVRQIEKLEEKPISSGGGGGGSSSGGSPGRETPCKLNCNPRTCKATGDAKCPD